MKILMFGRGVIATLYGWAFESAGHSVDFYVRPGRKAQFGPGVGLDIHDLRRKPKSKQHVIETWHPNMREDLPVDHDYDLIFVSVQHYQFAGVAEFLSTRASNATILIFNNFWEDPQEAAALLPTEQLAWGFPAAGGGYGSDGILHGAMFPKVEFGSFGTTLTAREKQARSLFTSAGFQINEHADFRDWLWVHFARNAGITAQALRAGSLQAVMRETGQTKEMVHKVREVMKVLAARGVELKGRSEFAPFKLPAWLAALLFNLAFRFNAALRASVAGHTNMEEVQRFYKDFMSESDRLGLKLPRMEAVRQLAGQTSG